MRFKLGCASAVLMFLCFDTSWGGALKNSFTKNKVAVETQNQEEKQNEQKQDVTVPSVAEQSKSSESAAVLAETKKEAAPKKEIKGNPVIYRIGKKEIRRDEILADIKSLPKDVVSQASADQLFNLIKRQKLMTYLVVEQAKKAGMDKENTYLAQVEKLKEGLLYETYLIKELEPKASNETTLQQSYRKYLVDFKAEPEIKASNIAVNTEKEAKEIIEALKKGAPFEKLQKEKGLASSENLERYVPVSRIQGELKSKFKAIEKNAVTTEPIKIMDTYHVIKIMDVRDTKPGTFEEMKPLLFRLILRAEIEKLLAKLESQYKVQKFNEDGTPEVAPAPANPATPAV